MFSGPGSIPDGLVWALYCDVSDLAYAMWITWQESCILQTPAPTASRDNSLANVGIYSFVIQVIYWLVVLRIAMVVVCLLVVLRWFLILIESMNCIVRLSLGYVGGGDWYGSPFTHRRSGLNLALQWHLCWPHVQGNSHGGTVFSGWVIINMCMHSWEHSILNFLMPL